jgi:hypothetical protein
VTALSFGNEKALPVWFCVGGLQSQPRNSSLAPDLEGAENGFQPNDIAIMVIQRAERMPSWKRRC